MANYTEEQKLRILDNMISYLICRSLSKEDMNFQLKDLHPFLKSMIGLIND